MKNIRVLFLSTEAYPFTKVGGLGDVAGSLPGAINSLPSAPEVRVVLPIHKGIDRSAFSLSKVAEFMIASTQGPIQAIVWETIVDEVICYLIEGDPISTALSVYSNDNYIDGFKYTFFSSAVVEMIKSLDWKPDFLHANDWHTAPAIYALKTTHNQNQTLNKISTLLTVHNLPYFGDGAGPAMNSFGLPKPENSNLPDWAENFPLPLGLWAADKINTVSPSYAEEILTPDFGAGLHDFLNTRRKDIFGILNGLDLDQWNPAKDQDVFKNYSRKTLVDRKENKRQLQLDLDMALNPSIPLLSFIGRMDYQKGVEFAIDALHQIRDLPWQAVFLGTGDSFLENQVRQLENETPNKVRALIKYDGKVARRIYAGADIIMIPSRYEPCGLVQMIGMRYGCVPAARSVGGLRDTIVDYDSDNDSDGFLFNDPTPESLAETLLRALNVFGDKRRWRGLQLRGMGRDFSWHRSAKQYLDLYQLILAERQ